MIGDRECIDVSIKSMDELNTMRWIAKTPSKVAVVDVETTGVRPSTDEILQVAICDGEGKELLSSYVLPERRKRWPDAQKVNGITWDMVKDSPTLAELSKDIKSILDEKKLVVGYNLRFDFSMLEAGGVDVNPSGYSWDIMNDCSVMMGNWSESRHEYLFARLQTVAKHYEIEYEPHNASEDVKATAAVFRRLVNDPEFEQKVREKENWLNEAKEREEERKRKEQEKVIEAKKGKRNGVIGCLAVIILFAVLAFASCSASCTAKSSYSKSSYSSTK